MIKKRKLLFIIDSLGTGGAERSLISLLSVIDYSKYEVDLQLFNLSGKLTSQIPKNVNLLKIPYIIDLLNKSVLQLIKRPGLLIRKTIYSFSVRYLKLYNAGNASLYWKLFAKYFDINSCKYDIGAGYSQGIPTFYTRDKVSANKKLVWVNVDYNISGWVKRHQKKYYEQVDIIVTVSSIVYNIFSSVIFPELKDKFLIIRDLINPEYIQEKAIKSFDIPVKKDLPLIMTVGRLNKPQKGYDIAIETAKILRDKGIKFRWYAVGEGPFRDEMEYIIKEYDLDDKFILLGDTDNPYNLMKQCDIYVQPSRHEGYGLTVAEAKILNKPVILTDFNTARLQIKDGINGLITSFEPYDIANKIELLIKDRDFYNQIVENLKKEKKGNLEEINKFYSLIKL